VERYSNPGLRCKFFAKSNVLQVRFNINRLLAEKTAEMRHVS
jgi:hypothetical protein